jgi:heat shock protein HslJ
MRNTILIFITIIISALVIFFAIRWGDERKKENLVLEEKQVGETLQNISFKIDGVSIQLVDGGAESKSEAGNIVATNYFGNELAVDLNKDGLLDQVFLVTQDTSGSGTFFYLVGALKTEKGYEGTEAIYIGDRIAPQTTEAGVDTVVVNYADRASGEPFTVSPSVGKSIVFSFDSTTKRFTEVVQETDINEDENVENPSTSLQKKTWEWVSAKYGDGREVAPNSAGVFMLTFNADGSFSATTDCNGVGGSYISDGESITFSDMVSTLMFCEDSQESLFTDLLKNTSSYQFDESGALLLKLSDSGLATFQ